MKEVGDRLSITAKCGPLSLFFFVHSPISSPATRERTLKSRERSAHISPLQPLPSIGDKLAHVFLSYGHLTSAQQQEIRVMGRYLVSRSTDEGHFCAFIPLSKLADDWPR